MRFLWLSALVVVADQATKAAVLQFLAPDSGIPQSIPLVGDWLRLTFTENPGMAFGITLGPPGTVTILSILATCLVVAYIYQVRNGYAPYVWSLALILGGAIGNIIDRVFYGVLLDYGTYFTGHVVDFVHVSLWRGFIPDAIPVLGGHYIELFPIWNVADMAIVLGVVGVLGFHRAFHRRRLAEEKELASTDDEDGKSSKAEWPATSDTDGVASTPTDETEEEPETSTWTPEDWPEEHR